MKIHRFCAPAVVMLAMFAADRAHADALGSTVVLNTYSKVWVAGDDRGPNRIGKDTGAGIMDAQFTWDQTAAGKANAATKISLGTIYTRSSNQANNANSYMQGGFALATLSQTGVTMDKTVDLPQLNGERAFMRPQMGLTPKYAVLIAASEDNGVNNNPQPVAYLADRTTGALVAIKNTTRGNINKPTNLIQTALNQGVTVENPDDQRGPHSIVQVSDNSFIIGMQYNNQAAEAFRMTVADDATITINWLERYSNTAQHCRPQVAVAEGATQGFITEVEANEQPAEIGFRLTKFDVATGNKIASKIVVRSDPGKNKYVAEPSIGILGTDKLAISYTMGSRARNRNGDNGHAGGAPVAMTALFTAADLAPVGDTLINSAQFSRHVHSYVTQYGPNSEPAVSVISGSSTGTGKGFTQLVPLKADGTLGLKDSAKVYVVSQYADVANLQARGKRNPNNQAKGFINGLGSVPNPGFDKGATAFMPEVKAFSLSVVTGYSGPEAATRGLKESIYLSLVPAAWKEGLVTTPGTATDKPGTNADGTGPLPRSNGPGTNPSGDSTSDNNVLGGTDPTEPGGASRPDMSDDNGGCSMSPHSATHTAGLGVALALAGIVAIARRKREEA